MKTTAVSPKLQPPPPGASDEDRYLYLLGCVASGIFSQFETVDSQFPEAEYDIPDTDTVGEWEEARSQHLASRCAMAASDLLAEFQTHRDFQS